MSTHLKLHDRKEIPQLTLAGNISGTLTTIDLTAWNDGGDAFGGGDVLGLVTLVTAIGRSDAHIGAVRYEFLVYRGSSVVGVSNAPTTVSVYGDGTSPRDAAAGTVLSFSVASSVVTITWQAGTGNVGKTMTIAGEMEIQWYGSF